jgi:ABC-type uncharacterized transport system permease subunit
MSLTAFIGSMELGLVYSLLAFGTFISYRILRVADLTVDGSFVLGAAASAMLTLEGMPFAGILAAMAAGAIAGVITALLQTKMGIQPILAGILTMTGLYSINLMVMGGKANIPLLNNTNIFTPAENFGGRAYKIIVLTAIITLIFMLLNWFFRTLLGLSIRATGDNEDMCKASSINTDLVKIVGFALSNSIVALSGAPLPIYGPQGEFFRLLKWEDYTYGVGFDENSNLTLGPFEISFIKNIHPLEAYSARIKCKDKVLSYTSDTSYFEDLAGFFKGSDLLICECSFYSDMDGTKAGHLTSSQAGLLAEKARVRKLILTHLPHFGDLNNLLAEAREYYEGEIELASYMKEINI